jgi:hypothetical protein
MVSPLRGIQFVLTVEPALSLMRNPRMVQPALAPDAVVACPRVSWSGYPIKLLNAMAAGKAIVACASAAYPLTHERDGLVVPDMTWKLSREQSSSF